jgi:hypothetical protein
MQTCSVNFHIAIVVLFSAIVCNAQDAEYDYSESAEYRALDAEEREKLDQVVKDMQSLEAAIKKHMRDHNGAAPNKLEALIPKYLPRLPRDPFFTPVFTPRKPDDYCHTSPSWAGYLYKRRLGPTFVKSWEPLTSHPAEDASGPLSGIAGGVDEPSSHAAKQTLQDITERVIVDQVGPSR